MEYNRYIVCYNIGIHLGEEKINKLVVRVAFWWLFNICFIQI
jgi:hypothetical protein